MFLLQTWQTARKIDRELVAIGVIYFIQGALGLAQLAVSFFFKDDLGLTPAETASLIGLVMVPWTVKPFYGFISDSVPIWGYRRRPYLVFFGILGALAWVGMATIVDSAPLAVLFIGIASLSVSFSDALIDALIVQRARLEEKGDAGSLQSFGWGAVSMGGVTAAFLSGYLLEHYGTRVVFLITALLPLIGGIASFAIQDDRVTGSSQGKFLPQWRSLRQAVTNPQILLPTAFLFLWQATPSADTAFFFFTTNDLHFNPQFLGTVRLVTNLAGLFGVWVFHRFLRQVPIRRIFAWTTVISTLLGLTTLILVTHFNRQLGIDDRWFSMGDSLILTVAGRIAFMPTLVLAARLCPEGVEATLFALLMSVLNLAGLCSQQLGALLTHLFHVTESDFQNLWLLILVANLSNLLPLPFLRWLPEK
jgi:folate/biopterin transporter